MSRKLFWLGVIFAVLCFAATGCFRGSARVDVVDTPYYDGPYRVHGGVYYYYDGGFYSHENGAYRFHHHVSQNERGTYEDRHRRNREHYHRDYRSWREEHREHPDASRRDDKR
jgi:hypothetical protein